jgi:Delta7-sterol 5-desaturase
MRTVLIQSVNGVVLYFCAINGIVTISYGPLDRKGILYLIVSTLGMIVAHDAYFYWTHRLMHHPKLFRWFHHTHHLSTTPTPFAAYAFSVPEAIVQTLIMLLWLLFVPMHLLGLAFFMVFMVTLDVLIHAGVELIKPGRLASAWWLGWLTSTTHHDHHHAHLNHNYGLYFSWWDKLMRTEYSKS